MMRKKSVNCHPVSSWKCILRHLHCFNFHLLHHNLGVCWKFLFMIKKDINHFYKKVIPKLTSYNLTHDLIHFKARLHNGYSRNKCQGGRKTPFIFTHCAYNFKWLCLVLRKADFSKTTTTHQILLEVPSTHPIPQYKHFWKSPKGFVKVLMTILIY